MYPSGRSSFNFQNRVKPVHGSCGSRSPSTFQQPSVRLSSDTSHVVFDRLTTSVYVSGIGNHPFFRHIKFDPWLNVMTMNVLASTCSVNFVLLEQIPPLFLWNHRDDPLLDREDFQVGMDVRTSRFVLALLNVCHLRTGTSYAINFLRARIWHASEFFRSSTTTTNMSPFQMPPAYKAQPTRMPGGTSEPNCWSLA